MKSDREILDEFFAYLRETVDMYEQWVNRQPAKLFINPEIMRKLSKLEGFYQRPEVRSAEVTAHAPMVRRFRVNEHTVLTIYEAASESFLRIE